MSTLTIGDINFGAMSHQSIKKVEKLEARMLDLEQEEVMTHHLIHAGLYARTIKVKKGVMITGANVKRATTLVISGHVVVWANDAEYDLEGYHVIPCSANRKQAFVAKEDTYITMLFPTDSREVEDCENEFTDDADQLMSRHNPQTNTIIITGD